MLRPAGEEWDSAPVHPALRGSVAARPAWEDSVPVGPFARAGEARVRDVTIARMAVAARLPAALREEAARCEKDAAMCRELSEIHRPVTLHPISIFSCA